MVGDGLTNEKIGLQERQIQTWDEIERVWQNHMIWWIRNTLEARIAREQGTQVEKSAGYLNDEKALKREFMIEPAPYETESAGGVVDEGRGIVDTMLWREPAGTPDYVKGTEPEDRVNSFITSM